MNLDRLIRTISAARARRCWLIAAGVLAGCAAQPVGDDVSTGEAARALGRAAERETRRPDQQAMRVEPPPGVPIELGQLARDDRARMTLTDVLAQWPTAIDGAAEAADSAGGIDPGAAREALRSYVIGRARRLAGENVQAEMSLKEAVRLDPSSAEGWRELGQVQVALGNRSASASAFRRALSLDPDDWVALEATGRDAFERRDFESAARLLGRLYASGGIRNDPALPYLTGARLGRSLLELGYFAAAAEALRQAVGLPEQFGQTTQFQADLAVLYRQRGDLWRDLGDAAMRQGRLDDAAECYERAEHLPSLNPLAITPRRVYVAMRRGRPADAASIVLDEIRAASGRVDPRLQTLLRFIAGNSSVGPTVAEALASMEREASARGDAPASAALVRARAACLPDAQAIEVLQSRLRQAPADEAALADLFQRIDSGDAARLVLQAIDLINASPIHEARYAQALMSRRRDPAALLASLASLPGERASPAGRLLRARLLAAQGDLDSAERELAALESVRPGFGPGLAARISVLWRLGRGDEARALVDALSESSAPGMLEAKVLALAELGEYERARETLTPSLPDESNATFADTDRLLLAAKLDLALGRFQSASRLFSLASRVDPTREEAYASLINIHARSGPLPDESRLLGVIRSLREANPSSPTLRWLRAQEALGRGQLDLAERDLLDLADEIPPRPGVVESLVRLWRTLGQTERADEWLREQVERRPEESVFHVQRAFLLADVGKMNEALAMLESRLESRPGDDAVSRALEALLRRDPSREPRADALARARLARSPNTPESLVELAEVAVRGGDLGEAASAVRRASGPDRSLRPDLAARLAQLSADLGAEAIQDKRPTEPVIEFVGAVIESQREVPPDVHLVLIRLLARSGMPLDRVIGAVERASTHHPGRRAEFFASAFDSLVRGRAPDPKQPDDRRTDRLKAGIALLEHACMTTNPPPAALHSFWLHLVAVNEETIDAESTARALEAAKKAGTEDRLLEDTAANLHRRDGGRVEPADLAYSIALQLNANLPDHPLIEWLYRVALRHNPDHMWTCNNLGYDLLVKDRNIAEAVALIERAHRLMLENANFREERASIVDSMGWARYKTGVIRDEVGPDGAVVREGAITLLRRAADLMHVEAKNQPEMGFALPILLDHLGDAYWAAGERERALECWTEAMTRADATLQNEAGRSEVQRSMLRRELQPVRDAAWSKIEAAQADRSPPVARIHFEADAVNAGEPVAPAPAGGMIQ